MAQQMDEVAEFQQKQKNMMAQMGSMTSSVLKWGGGGAVVGLVVGAVVAATAPVSVPTALIVCGLAGAATGIAIAYKKYDVAKQAPK